MPDLLKFKTYHLILISVLIVSCGGGGGGGISNPAVQSRSLTLEAHRNDTFTSFTSVTLTAYLTENGIPLTGVFVNWTADQGSLSNEKEVGGGYYSVDLKMQPLTPTTGETTVTTSYETLSQSIVVLGADYIDQSWDVPISLSINTSGWEDTPHISSDGQLLYFSYAGFDINNLLGAIGSTCTINTDCRYVKTGVDRPTSEGWHNFDVFRAARLSENKWIVSNSSINNYTSSSSYPPAFGLFTGLSVESPGGYNHNASPFVTENYSTMLTMMMTDTGSYIFFSDYSSTGEWGEPQILPSQVNGSGDADEPHVIKGTGVDYLYFNAKNIGCGTIPAGTTHNLCFVNISSGFSNTSSTIFDNVNTSGWEELQPFVTSNRLTLYFASDQISATQEILKSTRALVSDKFSTAQRFLSMQGFAGIGSPSFTSYSSEMFFVYVKSSTPPYLDAQLAYIKKKSP